MALPRLTSRVYSHALRRARVRAITIVPSTSGRQSHPLRTMAAEMVGAPASDTEISSARRQARTHSGAKPPPLATHLHHCGERPCCSSMTPGPQAVTPSRSCGTEDGRGRVRSCSGSRASPQQHLRRHSQARGAGPAPHLLRTRVPRVPGSITETCTRRVTGHGSLRSASSTSGQRDSDRYDGRSQPTHCGEERSELLFGSEEDRLGQIPHLGPVPARRCPSRRHPAGWSGEASCCGRR